jgi:hypothetical protein
MDNAPFAPVILLVFNRPEVTEHLIEALRSVQPQELLVVADGPRATHAEDSALCARVRELVASGITWPARVRTHFAERNLGLRQRVSSGLTWAFEQVDRAIILEDDCLAHPSFFRFCTELLSYYDHEPRVGVISGDSFQPQPFACPESYYFSRYPHCWGWATWRRAWKCFDNELRDWPGARESGWLNSLFSDPLEAEFWRQNFDAVHERRLNSWASAWVYSCWRNNLLTVLPRVNLVTNIGIGDSATHTRNFNSLLHELPGAEITFPLIHPSTIQRHVAADDFSQRHVFGRAKDRSMRGRLSRLGKKIRRKLGAG